MPSFPTTNLSEDHLASDSIHGGNARARTRCTKPMVCSGLLDTYTHQDRTPVTGREFLGLQAVDLLVAHKSDRLTRDLAGTSNSPPHLGAHSPCSWSVSVSLVVGPACYDLWSVTGISLFMQSTCFSLSSKTFNEAVEIDAGASRYSCSPKRNHYSFSCTLALLISECLLDMTRDNVQNAIRKKPPSRTTPATSKAALYNVE